MKKLVAIAIALFSLSAVFSQEMDDKPDALNMYRQGQYKDAIAVCLKELEETPRNMNSYAVLGWSYIASREYGEALSSAQKALEISRYDNRIIEILGEAYYYLGKNLEAIRWFEEYTVLSGTGDRIHLAYFFLGELFIRIGEYNHADIALTTAVYHNPNTARWWARLGYAREMAKDYSHSLLAYEEALKLNSALSEAVRGKERVQELL